MGNSHHSVFAFRVLLLGLLSSVALANLVVNGGFELPVVGPGGPNSGYQNFTFGQTIGSAWKVVGVGNDVSVFPNPETDAPSGTYTVEEGLQALDLTGDFDNGAAITTNPTETWMLQVGRCMTDAVDDTLPAKRYLILDRETKYSASLRKMIGESGTAVIHVPLRSLNLNAFAERFVPSIKEECLGWMIFVGQASVAPCRRPVPSQTESPRSLQSVADAD